MPLTAGGNQSLANVALESNYVCRWPGCGSGVINLPAEYRPLNSITGRTTSRN